MQRVYALFLVGFLWMTVSAREPQYPIKTAVRKTTKAAACEPSKSKAEMAFNNVRTIIENAGNMWMDRAAGVASYEVPKFSGNHSIFAGALWMGGLSPNGNLKLAAVTFRNRGNDFWPGPLTTDGAASVSTEVCSQYDRFFSASKADAIKHKLYYTIKDDQAAVDAAFPDGYTIPSYFFEWPAHPNNNLQGLVDPILAPFQDHPTASNEEGQYEPRSGDYPGYDLIGEIQCRDAKREVPLFGDTTVYWIFNDKGDDHTETNSQPIGMEIRAQAFAFADEGPVNNMTFYNYVLINQGSQTLNNTYFGQWVDADLGNFRDDYVGCDVQRGLGYCYNGDANDEVANNGYGLTPPAVGIDFFQGPFQDPDSNNTAIAWDALGLVPGDNPGPYDERLAPQGDKNIDFNTADQGDGIPYLGIGIGYADSVPDNERFGMRKFLFYTSGGGNTGDPVTALHHYNYLQGIWIDDTPFIYGGDGYSGTVNEGELTNVNADYMFPGLSDPIGWGTAGNTTVGDWSEISAGNAAGDRRFLQSAGPFTLKPGDINNITVGVVWARAISGDNFASVEKLLAADDIAQGLFDDCFQIFEGPDAPDLNIRELDRELILTLSNPESSNNFAEKYENKKTSDPDFAVEVDENGNRDTTFYDPTYRFEGYLIYQLRDHTVAVSDIDFTQDNELARRVAQVDIKNFRTKLNDRGEEVPDLDRPIDNLVNYELDTRSGLSIPSYLPFPANNEGILKSFKITEDKFALTADKRLLNNKPYYYVAVAYAYNNYLDYNPLTKDGQQQQFIASRKNGQGGSINVKSAIPHLTDNQNNGTILRTEYGAEVPITRLSGTGNDNVFVRMEKETEDAIMAGHPWYSQIVKYEAGAAPITVKVVDPLMVRDSEFEIRIKGKIGRNGEEYRNDSIYWQLIDIVNGDTVNSSATIGIGGEQIVEKFGLSVDITQPVYSGSPPTETSSFIGAEMEFEDPTKPWLTGFKDVDAQDHRNWIASGGNFQGSQPTDPQITYPDNNFYRDETEEFESILEGTWAPAALGRDTLNGPYPDVTSAWTPSSNGFSAGRIANTPNVDIVFTNDKSKWTRAAVIEMQQYTNQAVGGAHKGFLRKQASLDKNFLSVEEGGDTLEAWGTFDPDNKQKQGMSWFPGYAIDVLTGERLNIAFGENSYFKGVEFNGHDMIWNPTATRDFANQVAIGGMHMIMIYKNALRIEEFSKQGSVIDYDEDLDLIKKIDFATVSSGDMPLRERYISYYDSCKRMSELLYYPDGTTNIGKEFRTKQELPQAVFSSMAWIGFPILTHEQYNLWDRDTRAYNIPTETRIRLRVTKRFEPYVNAPDSVVLDSALAVENNSFRPVYRFKTDGISAITDDVDIVKTNLEQIRMVPNPYYAGSMYEDDRLENLVKFTNLPKRATISIYTLGGTLVKKFEKDDETTIVEWNIENDAEIPLASGMYIAHIDVPGVGQHIIKWLVVTRKLDLQGL